MESNLAPYLWVNAAWVANEVISRFSRVGTVAISIDRPLPKDAILLDTSEAAQTAFLTWWENQDTELKRVGDQVGLYKPPQPMLDCHPIQAVSADLPHTVSANMPPQGSGRLHFIFLKGNQVESQVDGLQSLRGLVPFNAIGDPAWFMTLVKGYDGRYQHALHSSVGMEFCPVAPDGKRCPRPEKGEYCAIEGPNFVCHWQNPGYDPNNRRCPEFS